MSKVRAANKSLQKERKKQNRKVNSFRSVHMVVVCIILAVSLALFFTIQTNIFGQQSVSLNGKPLITTAEYPYLFGTLLTNSSKAKEEKSAGIDVVELEMGWDAYEPKENEFSADYIRTKQQELEAYQKQGLRVVLGIGLQYPPSWVFSYPNSRYENQYGQELPHVVNLTFNKTLREKAQVYIDRVHKDLGLNNFWAIRVGAGGYVETLYPGETEMGSVNSYWAFDPAAQGSEEKYPLFLTRNPYPGWMPGQTTYKGKPFTQNDVAKWYDWYVTALVDGVNWQIWNYRSHGYTGFIHVLMPGQGVRPQYYQEAITNYLSGKGDINWTMGRGASWDKVLAKINNKTKVVAYVSSMADGSGNDDVCQKEDAKVALSDPQINSWSATRWISYLANKYHLPKNGENPGRPDTNQYGSSMMQKTMDQMIACGFQGVMWAHDEDLYSSDSGISLSSYSRFIKTYHSNNIGL